MQNRTQETGGGIFGVDGQRYDSRSDRFGQGPAMHIVGGGGERFGRGLHVCKNRSCYRKKKNARVCDVFSLLFK